MADKKFGITVFVKDKVTKAVKGMALAGKGLNKVFSAFANVGKAFGASLVVANQGLELLSKGWRLVSNQIKGSVSAAIELRGKTDPLVKRFKSLGSAVKGIRATFGTAFLSAVTAIGDAFRPVLKQAKNWMEENRAMIALKIVDTIFDIANALINGVAEAASIAAQSMATLRGVFLTSLKGIVDTVGAFAIFIGKEDELAEVSYKLEQQIIANDKAFVNFSDELEVARQRAQRLVNDGLKPAKKAAKEYADEAGRTGDKSPTQRITELKDALFKIQPAFRDAVKGGLKGLDRKEGIIFLEKLERRLDFVSRNIGLMTQKNLPEFAKALESVFKDMGVDFDFMGFIDTKDLDTAKAMVSLLERFGTANVVDIKEAFNILKDQFDLVNEKQKKVSKEQEFFNKQMMQAPQLIGQFGEAMGGLLANVAEGTQTLSQAVGSMIKMALLMVIGFIRKVLMAYAVQTMGLLLLDEVKERGALGLITGLLGASVVMGIFEGFIRRIPDGGIKKMRSGGMVTGGVPNRDSVPALLMPGEYVSTKEEVQAARESSGSGGGTVNMSINTAVPPSRAQMERYIRQNIIPAMRELKGRGVLV